MELSTVQKLVSLLNSRYRKILVLLVGFSLVISVTETAGISAIMPFISVSTNFSLIETNQYYRSIYEWVGFSSPTQFLTTFAIFLILFYILRGALSLYYAHLLARFSFGFQCQIIQNLFSKYMGLSYLDFTKKNSATLTKTITTEGNLMCLIISDALLLMSESFIVLFLYSLLLVTSWELTLLITFVMAMKGLFLTKYVTKRINAVGIKRENSLSKLYELLNTSFGNFKLNKLHGLKRTLDSKFNQVSVAFKKAQTTNTTWSHFFRIFLETGSMSVVIFLMLYIVLTANGNLQKVIPVISVFVLALYRLLPSVNRILNAYYAIVYNREALRVVYADWNEKVETLGNDQIVFKKKLCLEDVSFSYSRQRTVLKGLSLTIAKGEKVAFVGESGVGKSTLVDLIIGMHFPDSGKITVDGVDMGPNNIQSWRSKIGYVPQQIYLFDGTVRDNVIFYREYDENRLIESLKRANVFDFLQTMEGMETKVGEAGIQVSGGQRQRIAIARALYGDPDLLILDEATSSLDKETENEIMNEIYENIGDKTLIVIAHRLATVERCDKVYRMDEEGIYDERNYRYAKIS